MKTKVIFRKWRTKAGGIIAIFPQEPEAFGKPWIVASYEEGGQHGGCDALRVIRKTRKAKPEEYANLKKELEYIRYDLRVMQKMTRRDYEVRKKKLGLSD